MLVDERDSKALPGSMQWYARQLVGGSGIERTRPYLSSMLHSIILNIHSTIPFFTIIFLLLEPKIYFNNLQRHVENFRLYCLYRFYCIHSIYL